MAWVGFLPLWFGKTLKRGKKSFQNLRKGKKVPTKVKNPLLQWKENNPK